MRTFILLFCFLLTGYSYGQFPNIAVTTNEYSQNEVAATYNVNFDAGKLSSGIYFYSISAGNFYHVKKMIIAK
jgi:hypothetical protein